MQTLRKLSAHGQPLRTDAPTATINNPAWWIGNDPLPRRQKLLRRLMAKWHEAQPDVEQNREAIILVGPPGAGKSTLRDDKNVVGAEKLKKYLRIDADEFKTMLLEEAIADGSYESWIKPEPVRVLEAQGERFFPLELASLVHEESSYLAKQLRTDAIAAGSNLFIDAVMSNEKSAQKLAKELEAANYRVQIIDLEVPATVSEERIRQRWQGPYIDALNGKDTLGGRWVPSDFVHNVFAGPEGQSRPEAVARLFAENCPIVTSYQVFRTSLDQARSPASVPKLEVDLVRMKPGAALVDRSAADKVHRAGLSHSPRGRARPHSAERD